MLKKSFCGPLPRVRHEGHGALPIRKCHASSHRPEGQRTRHVAILKQLLPRGKMPKDKSLAELDRRIARLAEKLLKPGLEKWESASSARRGSPGMSSRMNTKSAEEDREVR